MLFTKNRLRLRLLDEKRLRLRLIPVMVIFILRRKKMYKNCLFSYLNFVNTSPHPALPVLVPSVLCLRKGFQRSCIERVLVTSPSPHHASQIPTLPINNSCSCIIL